MASNEVVPQSRSTILDFSNPDFFSVEVGPHKTLFTVHRHILAHSSDFFKRTIDSGFRESVEKHISLPEQDPNLFNIYLNWLYANSLPTDLGKETQFDGEEKEHWEDIGDYAFSVLRLVRLIIFADVILDACFHNLIMDRLIEIIYHDTGYPSFLARYTFNSSPESFRLRNLIVDMSAVCNNVKGGLDWDFGPAEFWREVARRRGFYYKYGHWKKAYLADPWAVDRRRYHVHDDEDLDACKFCNVNQDDFRRNPCKNCG